MFNKLTIFSIKSFIGPFVVTFFISMFMLILQFTWLYIDDLMGKNLSVWVLMELLFYVSARLIPLALPLAILLSSIMTLGNLAESNELTAMKSSGMSLWRILRPLTQFVVILSVITFFFSNYVIPVANLKWQTIIYDIQSTKVNTLLTPGTFSNNIDGYSIKVKSGSDNSFKGVTIIDYSDANVLKTVKADSGTVFTATDGKQLLFHLINGSVHEEMQAQAPTFDVNNKVIETPGNHRPSRSTTFKKAIYRLELQGFDLNKSKEDLFKKEYEMLTVFQIREAEDSLQSSINQTSNKFATQSMNQQAFFAARNNIETMKSSKITIKDDSLNLVAVPRKVIRLQDLSDSERLDAVNAAIVTERSLRNTANEQNEFIKIMAQNYDLFHVEFHRKFALSGAIIVLFFVGAPLGAIVRKGGFGAPVVIAALLFMVYFVLFTVGENLAGSGVLTPFLGMWIPTFVLLPFAIVLMSAAANDLPVFSKKLWQIMLTFGIKR